MDSADSKILADPFAQIFSDWAEADWAFDFLQETVKHLGLTGPYDTRFALTLTERAGNPRLHLTFGHWLIVGFSGPGSSDHRVDLTLLADRVAWDQRLTPFSFSRKEGEPEVRTYQLPLEIIKPLTRDLQAAFEATLAFIADKFRHWKRPPSWKQHQPEIIQALFDTEARSRLFAGALTDTDLRYERHRTSFYQDVSEEEAVYEVDKEMALDLDDDSQPDYYQRRSSMNLLPEKIDEMIALVRQAYPNWSGFSDPDFVKDEIEYKQATIAKTRELLSESELKRLIKAGGFDEFIDRLLQIGRDNNMLWRSVPSSGDLNILHDPQLDKPTFCEAFLDLIYGPEDSPERLGRYVEYVQTQNLPDKWTFPTYFLFLCHPDSEMFVKPRTTRWFVRFFDGEDAYSTKPTASGYAVIKQLAHHLKNGLQEYGPRDMVDVQSFIWVCRRRVGQVGTVEEDDELELAEPFSQIFVDWEEAEWAFDFLREAFKRLGIESPDDPRFALILARRYGGLNLHFDFGNWLILGFREPGLRVRRIRIPLIADRVDLEEFIEHSFAQSSNEPHIVGYGMPIDRIKSLDEKLQVSYEVALHHIAKRFQNYALCPWRNRYHQSEIAEAVFDLEKREQLLSEGLEENLPEATGLEDDSSPTPPYPLSQMAGETGFAEETLARWVQAIQRKGQAILYGPPGTGKTYLAEKLAQHLVAGGDGFVDLVQFHPAYAYEDFIQGLRPQSRADGSLSYPLLPGRFLQFSRRAEDCRDICVLIIDEINRADLARVFGELMYLLEYRDRQIPLAGGGMLRIPANVRLIGTMNTADRSIALVDHALRRRFAFLAFYPNYEILRHYHRREQTGFPLEGLIDTLTRLNRQINDPHYAVGVTFFLRKDLAEQLEAIWRMEIEPYLEEYFFDQPEKVDLFRWEVVREKITPEQN